MAIYKIYNLQTIDDVFECESYLFQKRSDYNKRVKSLYKPGHIIENKTLKNGKMSNNFIIKNEFCGAHQITFHAKNTGDCEDRALLALDGKRIYDIIYLMRFLTGTFVCLHDESKLYMPRYEKNALINEKYGTKPNILHFALNTMITHLTSDIVDKWDLMIVFHYYFDYSHVLFMEQKIGDISTCFEILSQNYYRQNISSKKHAEEIVLFLKQLNKFVRESHLSNIQKSNLLSTKLTRSLFDKSTAEKHFDFLRTLPWSNDVDNNALMTFAKSIHLARNIETHNGRVVSKLKAFERIPKAIDEERKHDAKRDYVMLQTDILKIIIKYFVAKLLGYQNGFYELQETKRIIEFINLGTVSGWNPLSGISWEEHRKDKLQLYK